MATATAYSTQASYLASVEEQVTVDLKAASERFNLATMKFERDYGIAYGRALWNARKKLNDAGYGQLSSLLDKLSIPRSTAYFWLEKYEVDACIKVLPVIPCPHCEMTFPSKTQMKHHLHHAHLSKLAKVTLDGKYCVDVASV
jgi:hypothetical protein